MAEPTDTPRGAAAPYPVSSPQVRPETPAAPPTTDGGEQQEYHPVAILAVVALGVAGLYGLTMAICAGVSFILQRPLILDGWTCVVPLMGAALALVAWLQIQRSEGALGGGRLALVGGGICMVVGLVYWSYYLATYLTITRDAERFSDAWIDHVTKGNMETAFWHLLNPAFRPSLPANPENDPVFRNTLEVRFDAPSGAGAATLSQFARRDEVHFLRQAGSELKVEPMGVTSWEYSGNGYIVQRTYRFTTPAGSLEMKMILHGDEAKHGEFPGRQWYIEPDRLTIVPETIRLTLEGQRASALSKNAREYLDRKWLPYLFRGDVDEAYLDTVPVADRDALRQTILERNVAADCILFSVTPFSPSYGPWLSLSAAAVNYHQMLRDSFPGFKAFQEGGLFYADRNRFWVPLDGKKPDEPDFKESFTKKQEEVENAAKALFAHSGSDFTQSLEVNSSAHMPMTRHENGVYSVELEFSMQIPSIKHSVDGLLFMECTDAAADKGPPIPWRIARLELLRAKPLAEQGPPGRGGRMRPGMPQSPPQPPPAPRGGP